MSEYAFPGFENFIHDTNKVVLTGKPHGGLTKRELFAAMAMMGIQNFWNALSHQTSVSDPKPDVVAQMAVEQADALIAALEAK